MDFCPNLNCKNKTSLMHTWPDPNYIKAGFNKSGVQQYQCRHCKRIFLDSNPKVNPLLFSSNLNKAIFRLLLNGRSFEQIYEETTIPPIRLFRKISYWSEQLSRFENNLLQDFPGGKECFGRSFNIQIGKLGLCIYERGGYVKRFSIDCNQGKNKISSSPDIVQDIEKFTSLARKKLFLYEDLQASPENYNERLANQILNIFRIHFNFRVRSKENMTPAMSAKITSQVLRFDRIITLSA